MRSDDDVALFASGQCAGIVGGKRQGIGIEYERRLAALEQAADQGGGTGGQPQPRPAGNDVLAQRQHPFQRFVAIETAVRLSQRVGHEFRGHRRQDRQARRRRGHGHQPGS
jgi:hypothetical protein